MVMQNSCAFSACLLGNLKAPQTCGQHQTCPESCQLHNVALWWKIRSLQGGSPAAKWTWCHQTITKQAKLQSRSKAEQGRIGQRVGKERPKHKTTNCEIQPAIVPQLHSLGSHKPARWRSINRLGLENQGPHSLASRQILAKLWRQRRQFFVFGL